MEVIVQLADQAAGDFLHERTSDPDVAQLRRLLGSLGVAMRPQHPDVDDPGLSRYFVAEVRDRDQGARVVAALTALHIVTAAYAKPQAEPP